MFIFVVLNVFFCFVMFRLVSLCLSVAILAQGLTFSGSAPGGRPGGVGL